MTHGKLEHVSEVPPTVTADRKYRVLVRVKGEEAWIGNQLVFDSEQEAVTAAQDLYSRWTAVEQWKIEEVAQP